MLDKQRYEYFDIHTHRCEIKEDTLRIYSSRAPEFRVCDGLFSYGVHPYDVLLACDEWLDVDFGASGLIAMGEVGLDFRFAESVREQLVWFGRQVALAVEHGLPLVIHCVKAQPQVLAVLRKFGVRRFVFHGFRGSIVDALEIVSVGGCVSFGEVLLRDTRLQAVLREVGLENVFFESDESGVEVRELYELASMVCEVNMEDLKKQIKSNYTRVFDGK